MSSATPLLDPAIFTHLKDKIDEESQVREALTQIIQRLERAVSATQGLLARVHSTPRARYPEFVAQVEAATKDEVNIVGELSALASKHPYYKYNSKWTRTVQNAINTVLLCGWLGGHASTSKPGELGRLLTLEEVGALFNVPTSLKDQDAFHLTLEEYLLALTELTSELARLAPNAVVLGDFELPLVISAFVKDLFAGFQLLNLKNDIIRKRADAVKYDVKRVEDVVYDLSLRGLVKRNGDDTEMKNIE